VILIATLNVAYTTFIKNFRELMGFPKIDLKKIKEKMEKMFKKQAKTKQAKTFDFFRETEAIRDCDLTKGQAEVAKNKGITRILKLRCAFDLPKYIMDAAHQKGYRWVMLGFTTSKSSTWGFYRR
jgi:hypothetical protein